MSPPPSKYPPLALILNQGLGEDPPLSCRNTPKSVQRELSLERDSLGGDDELPPAVLLLVAGVLAAEVLGHLLRGELRLADVAKVPRQVDRLA